MNNKQFVKFGDICREVKLNTKDPLGDGYERYIGLEHLDSGTLKIKRWGMIEEDNPSFTRVFKKGHILFGKRRPYLKKAAIAEFDGVCSGDIIVIKLDENESVSKLIPYIIHSSKFWAWAVRNSSGSLSPRTKFSSISEFLIPIKSEVETKKLSLMLRAITEIEGKIDSVKRALYGVLDAIVIDISRHPALGFISLHELGVSITAGKSPKASERPPEYNELGVLKVSSITSGKFCSNESKTLGVGVGYDDELLVNNGDLLISRANGNPSLVGLCCIVDNLQIRNLYLSDKTLRLNCEQKLKRFIKFFINSPLGRKQVSQLWSGSSGQKNISQDKILSIQMPNIAEDRVELIDKAFYQIESFELAIDDIYLKIDRVKNALTKKLLEG